MREAARRAQELGSTIGDGLAYWRRPRRGSLMVMEVVTRSSGSRSSSASMSARHESDSTLPTSHAERERSRSPLVGR